MIELRHLQDVHPVVLKEIGLAMQRIAEANLIDISRIKVKADTPEQIKQDIEAEEALDEVFRQRREEHYPRHIGVTVSETEVIGHSKEGEPIYDGTETETSVTDNGDGTATVTMPANGGGGVLPVELDTAGLPWDVRIHASTKTKVKDGTWKSKRGLDETTKQSVIAELRVNYPEPTGPQTDLEGHVVASPEQAFGQPEVTVTQTSATIPTPHEQPGMPPAVSAPPAQTVITEYGFVNLLQECTQGVSEGHFTQETSDVTTKQVFSEFGLTGWPDVQAKAKEDPSIIGPIRERLSGLLGPRV